MSEYVSRCTLEANGQDIDDFKSFTENEIELRKVVKLMNKTGSAGLTPRYGFEVDYVVPEDTPEFDWEALKDGTFTVVYENGKRKSYTGVSTLKIGQEKIDGENETVRTISLMAVKRLTE